MSVRIEKLNIIVPISKIQEILPGGFATFLTKNQRNFGGTMWYDDFLLRDGAMTPIELKKQILYWQSLGFVLYENREDGKHWKDLCVVTDISGGEQAKCDWLVFGPSRTYVSFAGEDSGAIIGRVEMQQIIKENF